MRLRDIIAVISIVIIDIDSAGGVYRISREEATWGDSLDNCHMFGGDLARLENLDHFREQMRDNAAGIVFETGTELWVGASLEPQEWRWENNKNRIFQGDSRYYERQGCFRQQLWTSGTRIDNISPAACLNLCNWSGPIGLKKDYCLCKNDLLSISLTQPGTCHISCMGSPEDMCGGHLGLSVYRPGTGKAVISWAEGEPTQDRDCVLLRRDSAHSPLDLITADCQLQTRYLCIFASENICGVAKTCIRWSTTQATWSDARTSCKEVGEDFADIDVRLTDMNENLLKHLPPGIFWIAMRRRRNWIWTSGNTLPIENFFLHERRNNPSHACAVVQYLNGRYGFAARPCESKSHYLCQYDFMQKRGEYGSTAASASTQNETLTGSRASSAPPPKTAQGGNAAGNLDDDAAAASSSSSSNGGGFLNTCMYVILGFVTGMVVVLVVGLIVYAVYRCKQPQENKLQRTSGNQISRDNAGGVRYSAKNDSVRISSQMATSSNDVTYDTVYDLETESPFRRTQRLIKMGSANSWRTPRRARSDTMESNNSSDYTWRGMIGGKIEIINTELRHPEVVTSHGRNFDEQTTSITSGGSRRRESTEAESKIASSETRRFPAIGITTDLPQSDGIYDLPSSVPADKQSGSRISDFVGYHVDMEELERNFPSFLELETKTDEASNEENIYATIKKTFQKIKDDMGKRKSDCAEEMMYTVQLNQTS